MKNKLHTYLKKKNVISDIKHIPCIYVHNVYGWVISVNITLILISYLISIDLILIGCCSRDTFTYVIRIVLYYVPIKCKNYTFWYNNYGQ